MRSRSSPPVFGRSPRPLRPLGLVGVAGRLNPPLVIVTIVVTGNHFVLDAVAGSAVLCAGLLAVGWGGETSPRVPLARVRCVSGGSVFPSLQWTPRRGVEQPGSSPGS